MPNLDFQQDYTLEDAVALLRPLRADDAPHLLPFSLQEPELWTYSASSAAGADALKAYIERALEDRAAGLAYPFIVFDKRTGKYAGSTRFYDIQRAHQTLSIGYTWYGKAFQGTGLNGHCKRLLLRFAFDELGIERVEFRADVRNLRSIAAMKKIGCVEEGILREHLSLPDGKRRSSAVLSILRREYPL